MSLIKHNWPTLTNFFDDNWVKNQFNQPDWSPAVNVSENDSNYEIEFLAPGIKKEDFSVEVKNDTLVVSGSSSTEKEEETKKYTRKEFSSRSFTRSFNLPTEVDAESINANYKDGILKLTLAKTEEPKERKKEIAIS